MEDSLCKICSYKTKKISITLPFFRHIDFKKDLNNIVLRKCMNCQMQTRLFYEDKNQELRAQKLGLKDLHKKYNIEEMVKDDVIFCATGVTDGDFVKGIKNQGSTFTSETLVLHKSSKTNEVLKNVIKK